MSMSVLFVSGLPGPGRQRRELCSLVESWMRENRGPEARLGQAASEIAGIAGRIPGLVSDMEAAAAAVAHGGVKLHPDTVGAFARANDNGQGWLIWFAIGALALILILSR